MRKIIGLLTLLLILAPTTLAADECKTCYVKNEYVTELFNKLNQHITRLEEEIEELKSLQSFKVAKTVTITAYTATRKETDSTPTITASNTKIKPYDIAVSRDLFKAGWVFESKVWIEGKGIFTIRDLMNARHTDSIDIYYGTKKAALKFGKRRLVAVLLRTNHVTPCK